MTVTIALMVVFAALLIGKILMEMFPNSGFGTKRDDRAKGQAPEK